MGADSQQGPVLGVPEHSANSAVQLEIRSPSRSGIGAETTFELSLRNGSNAALEDVSVESEFDAAFRFPGSNRTRVRQKLGRLAAGEERSIALTLIGEKPGTHCCRFVVASRGAEVVWKSVCVDVSAAEAGLKLIGPKLRYVGDRAEFTAKIENTSTEKWAQVRATCLHPASLVPREASTGVKQSEGTLTWNLGDLEPGEGIQLQMEFECMSAVREAPVEVRLAAEGGGEERCGEVLQVDNPDSPLRVRVSDTEDLLSTGEETEYLVEFENRGRVPIRLEQLSVTVPELLRVVSADIRPKSGSPPPSTEVRLVRNQIQMVQGDQVPARTTHVLHIRVKCEQPGDGELTVHWQEAGQAERVLSEPTSVNR